MMRAFWHRLRGHDLGYSGDVTNYYWCADCRAGWWGRGNPMRLRYRIRKVFR